MQFRAPRLLPGSVCGKRVSDSMKALIAAGLVVLAAGPGANAQGFLTNCTWQTAMLVDSYLGTYCHNNNWQAYSYDWSWFDISNCLINYGGQLVAYDSGNYWQTCKGCTIFTSSVNFLMTCTCMQSRVSLTTSTYDLNQVIWNHDGYLGCFEHFGNRSERGPF
ncbi:hypothetical protein GGS21DRAFT_238707 [Xylaria nigripes]|nr:hypothetical protein GGS21DRAFT_238707 [Xylaria nigripes]